MKTRTVLFLAILASVLFFPLRPFGSVEFLPNAHAALDVPNPSITLQANFAGWNSSQPSGTNPTISSAFLFPGQNLTSTAFAVDGATHTLAFYQPGTTPSQVSLSNTCAPGNLCLARVNIPFSGTPSTLKFAFPSAQTFELYCEFHPNSMHSQVFVYRSPDLNGDHKVNIIDLVGVALAFGSTPTSLNWNPNADLNRDNSVSIIDLVIVSVNFGRIV
jgi:hypothetical protein